jgi:hypothetical protein
MDFSLISAAVTSLRAAKDIGTAAIELRDWNQMVGELTKMNGELLKAQDALFAHNASLLELHGKYADACNELRKMKDALNERSRYALFEIGAGKFAYRLKVGGTGEAPFVPGADEPMHYLCQPCFDAGRKMVLQLYLDAADGPVAMCPHCKHFFEAERARQ